MDLNVKVTLAMTVDGDFHFVIRSGEVCALTLQELVWEMVDQSARTGYPVNVDMICHKLQMAIDFLRPSPLRAVREGSCLPERMIRNRDEALKRADELEEFEKELDRLAEKSRTTHEEENPF